MSEQTQQAEAADGQSRLTAGLGFDIGRWGESLLFTDAGGMQPGSPGSKISQHLLCHWLKRLVFRRSFKNRTDFPKVGLISSCNGKH